MYKFQPIVAMALFIVVCIPSIACAEDIIVSEDLPNLIQQKYETLKTFQADYVQELTNVASGEVEIRKGRILFRQPSQVRWEADTPEKELLIVGPQYAWDYIEADALAIKYDVAMLLDSKTIIRFISGQANLKEDFIVKTEWQGADSVRERWGKGNAVLQLVPKEAEPGMVLAYLGVDPHTGLLRQVMIIDFYGNGNEVRLTNLRENVELSNDLFSFTPPKGIQIENNTQGN